MSTKPDKPTAGPAGPRIQPHALCETEHVGDGTRVWAFAHILPGARIGALCNICDHARPARRVRTRATVLAEKSRSPTSVAGVVMHGLIRDHDAVRGLASARAGRNR